MPTTSGTGSETTRTAILSDADGAKLWFWGEELKADEVVLDPELTVSLPPHLTAATGIDALVHAVEAATNRNAHPANDIYAHEAIRLVARHLVDGRREPRNLAAREGLALAAALAGTAIDNCGTAIAHNIGHAHGLAAADAPRPRRRHRHAGLPALECRRRPDGRFAACAAAMGGRADRAGLHRRL